VSASLRLAEIRDLAYRFVPGAAADRRLYEYGPRSWWPAHEIGHFLVATRRECRQPLFGLDFYASRASQSSADREYRYVIAREIAAISISQRLLRQSGHTRLADEEIQYTDENTLECGYERWCKRSASSLLRANNAVRLPSTFHGLEALLTRKAREVSTSFHLSRRAAETGQACQTS
jgi:hypothetical protein